MSERPAFQVFVHDRNGLPLLEARIEFIVNGIAGFVVKNSEGRGSIDDLKPDDRLEIKVTYRGQIQTAKPAKDIDHYEFKFDVDTPHPHTSLRQAIGYAVLSLVFLGIAIVVGKWVLTEAPTVGPNSQFGFYGAVVLLGISAAVVLFGCMRSYAHVSGHQGPVQWEVGGPAALAVLVVIGAYVLAKPEPSFSLTVRLANSVVDAEALSELKVIIDLGQRRDERPFNSSGEAFIPDIPTAMVNQEVHVALSPGRVRLKNPQQPLTIPADRVLYLDVVVIPPEDPRRAAAREKITEIRILVRMTLISQNETLYPAFERFKKSPDEQNWAAVQKAASDLLAIVETGTRAALEYDAAFGPAMSQLSVVADEGRSLVEKSFTLREQRKQWNNRKIVLDHVVKQGPPSQAQADIWLAELQAIYQKLEASLQSIESQLASNFTPA